MRVQHRHIIYIQGYDPRGLAQYYRMFRTELRKFGRLYQLSATMSRPKVAADDEIASWTIETKADDWQTRTNYDFLRFEDFIQRDLAAPIWRTVFQAVWIYWRLVFAGTIARFWQGELAFRDLHHLPAFRAAAGSRRAPPASPLCSKKAWTRSAFPTRSASRRRPRSSSPCSAPC